MVVLLAQLRRSARADARTIALTAFATVIVGAAFFRHFFGLDLTDEGYYLGVPYRFALGARPFVDETNAVQSAGLLAYPFIALYHATVGVGGIFLFARQLHFLFMCGVAACVFVGLRPFVGTRNAVLPSLLPVVFVPFNLPDLSYNNLGSGFLVAGCFLGLRFVASRQRSFLAAAGLTHGLAIFAYPPLVVPSLVYAAVLAFRSGERWRRVLLPYALMAIIPIAVLAALIANAGPDNVRAIVSNAHEFGGQGGGLGKGASLLRPFVETVLRAPLGILAVAGVLGFWRRRPALVMWLLPLTPLLLVPLQEVSKVQASLDYVTIFGLAALPLYLLLRTHSAHREVFLSIWPAAFVGGCVTSWSSNNGIINFGVGFAPAPIVAMVLITGAFVRARQGAAGEGDVRRDGTFAASGALVVLVVFQFASVYRDGGFSHLDTRIRAGPFAGIYTTPERRLFIDAISADLRSLAPPACRILFYDNFPAGYLLAPGRGYTNAVWLLRVPVSKEVAYRRVLLRYYADEGSLPDVVVRMNDIPGLGTSGRLQYSINDPLDRLVRQSGRYKLAAQRAAYGIYERRAARC
jgi:hypothetical protein